MFSNIETVEYCNGWAINHISLKSCKGNYLEKCVECVFYFKVILGNETMRMK